MTKSQNQIAHPNHPPSSLRVAAVVTTQPLQSWSPGSKAAASRRCQSCRAFISLSFQHQNIGGKEEKCLGSPGCNTCSRSTASSDSFMLLKREQTMPSSPALQDSSWQGTGTPRPPSRAAGEHRDKVQPLPLGSTTGKARELWELPQLGSRD